MAINIKNLETRIQKKAASVTSNTPTAELGDIIEAANLATGGLAQYDSAGLLPTASSTQNIKIAYIKKDNSIRFNSGSAWNTMTPNAAVGGAVPTGPSYTVQGETYGWVIGGYPGPANYHNQIQRFAFSPSSANATDVADMNATKYSYATGKSATHGLYFGGASYPGYAQQATVSKFPFASGSNAVAGTDMTNNRSNGNRTPVQGDTDYAYLVGHGIDGAYSNDIVRIVTTVDAVEADVGDMTVPRNSHANSSSGTHGYTAGGYNWPNTPAENDRKNVIDKFPFAATANATDVGDITSTRNNLIGTSSTTHGYINGGDNPSQVQQNIIEKYAFASDGNSTDVGDLTSTRRNSNASSAPDKGFIASGGVSTNANRYSDIQSYPFASDTNATDGGDLVTAAASGGSTEN
tara:strand:+ start:25 stop:1245 length:1221 start_codon:yes stop_codon:yes gene_type:complete